MVGEERMFVFVKETEREGEMALKAVCLTYTLPVASLTVVLPITPLQ